VYGEIGLPRRHEDEAADCTDSSGVLGVFSSKGTSISFRNGVTVFENCREDPQANQARIGSNINGAGAQRRRTKQSIVIFTT